MKRNLTAVLAATLAVAACDGSSGNNPPVNQIPTIGVIADQTVVANQPGSPIGFSVGDDDSAGLTVAATSDNPAVIADSGLALAGSGNDRSITLTPVVDTTGDAFITITVTDAGGLMAGTTFLATVTPETKSLQQFSRSEFMQSADGDPALINAVEFTADAVDDDFADLLAQ
ncbi:MAG: hypothetical protein AAFX58_01160 [Pseudomonadota bacterium]